MVERRPCRQAEIGGVAGTRRKLEISRPCGRLVTRVGTYRPWRFSQPIKCFGRATLSFATSGGITLLPVLKRATKRASTCPRTFLRKMGEVASNMPPPATAFVATLRVGTAGQKAFLLIAQRASSSGAGTPSLVLCLQA